MGELPLVTAPLSLAAANSLIIFRRGRPTSVVLTQCPLSRGHNHGTC